MGNVFLFPIFPPLGECGNGEWPFLGLWTFPTLSIWSQSKLLSPGPDMPLNRNATCLTGWLVCVSVPMRACITPGVGIDTSGTHGPTRAQGGRLGGPQGREVGGLVGLVWVGLGRTTRYRYLVGRTI